MRRLLIISTVLLLIAGLATGIVFAVSPSPSATPSVVGAFNQRPTLTIPSSTPPSSLVVKILHEGTGKVVQKKDSIAVNYLGQIWGGKVFDTTFTRQLSGFPIGVGQVIPGWDTAIVGKRVGSRLLLVIPPKDGYGSKGNSAIGVTATSTMVFVIDIVAEYNSSVTADPKATPVANVVNGITISGSMTSAAKVTIASGTAQPTAANVTLVDRGHGKNIKPGLVILQTVVTNWSGVTQASTWTLGTPDAETVGQTSNPSLLDKLVGMPIGSRFLAVIPKTSGQGPFIIVIDVVAQPHGLASQPG